MKLRTSLVLSVCVLAPMANAAKPQNVPLAPPVSVPGGAMWSWQDVPRNERIPITRALFDQSGYVLYDDNGQAISVPFTDNNLYIMQFGRTSGSMYFVSEEGRTPTLYLPSEGYLENGCVSGARWYPFPERYFYTRPVYLGLAPSWDSYRSMGWYSSTVIYGGYCGYDPWRVGVTFRPMPGLYITVDGRSCRDWDDYCGYWRTSSVRPLVIVDRRPTYRDHAVIIDRNERPFVYGSNSKSWDRPGFRETTMRPDYKAPARETEERGQLGSRFDSRERTSPPIRGNGIPERGNGIPERGNGIPERGNNPSVRESRPLPQSSPLPPWNERRDMSAARPSTSGGFGERSGSTGERNSGTRPTLPTSPTRERETRTVRESAPGRDSYRPPSREVSPSRDNGSSKDSGSSRESRGSSKDTGTSRERERGRK